MREQYEQSRFTPELLDTLAEREYQLYLEGVLSDRIDEGPLKSVNESSHVDPRFVRQIGEQAMYPIRLETLLRAHEMKVNNPINLSA